MAGQFKVLSQRQSLELMGDGQFRDVMEVTFESTLTQHTGIERIPLREYTAENVGRILRERVETMDAIHELGQ